MGTKIDAVRVFFETDFGVFLRPILVLGACWSSWGGHLEPAGALRGVTCGLAGSNGRLKVIVECFFSILVADMLPMGSPGALEININMFYSVQNNIYSFIEFS